ncbi:Circadian clock-controlled protein [Papilio xuthus]|uniref:Circadian clock-controlled protein n=1 Tax=Papilio xuthus TaxID=66420 RepID=A0A194PUD6_PAPXU|nr:Circadian clock-controlled protein [Papilio xuthus]
MSMGVVEHLGVPAAPPLVQPCLLGDSECLIKANTRIALSRIGYGLPEFGIESLEPMRLRNITMGAYGFSLVFREMNVAGASKCNIEDINLNFVQSTMGVTLECPLEATGSFKMSGNICFFDVNHEGNYIVKTDSIRTTVNSRVDTVYGADGHRYWKLTLLGYSYEPLENLHIGLGRLFVGEVTRASPLYKVVSNNWWPLVSQVAEPAVSTAVNRFHDVLKTFFLRVPLEQLAK